MQVYRFLTEDDTSDFCHKVTKALSEGWELYGQPAYAFDVSANKMRCGQAVTKETTQEYSPDMKLGNV